MARSGRRTKTWVCTGAAAALALLSCKDDPDPTSDTETGTSSGGPETTAMPMSDTTGTLQPCMTDLQPHGQCLEPLELGADPILDMRVGTFHPGGRESIATKAVQEKRLGLVYADDDGAIVLDKGDPIALSDPYELVVGRFHADIDADELLWLEPDFSGFHVFRYGDGGFELITEEPLLAQPPGHTMVAFDVNGDGAAEIYEIHLFGTDLCSATPTKEPIACGRVLARAGTSWGPNGTYDFSGGTLTDAGVILDVDQDGSAELVVPLAGNIPGPYSPMIHRFVAYSGAGNMLVAQGVYPAGDKPDSLHTGDFDGDGFSDLLVKGVNDVVAISSSPEGLASPVPLMIGGGLATRARACDVDGDGIDEVVTLPGSMGGSMLLWNDVLGALEIETVVMVTKPQQLECPDLDGDGRDEIVFRDDDILRVLRPLETL